MRLGTEWVLVPKTYCLPPLLHRLRSGGSLWCGCDPRGAYSFAMAPRFTPDERRRLIDRTEKLLGRKKLAALIERHRNHPGPYPHRLIDQHLRMRRAENDAGNYIVDDDSLVAATEVAGILDELERWINDPIWPEYRRALNEARDYVHTAVALCFANALRINHPATELVSSGRRSRKATPDLRMVVTLELALAVEVKAPTTIGSRSLSMTHGEAAIVATRALKEALKQLAGGPGMLVIGNFNIDRDSFNALSDAAGDIVERDGSETNLMAIVIANLFVGVGDSVGAGPSEIGFSLKTRIRSNRLYAGPIAFEGDWEHEWRLLPREGVSKRSIYVVRRRLVI